MTPTPGRPARETFPADLSGAGKRDIKELAEKFGVDFVRLQFTDILGVNKNVHCIVEPTMPSTLADALTTPTACPGDEAEPIKLPSPL